MTLNLRCQQHKKRRMLFSDKNSIRNQLNKIQFEVFVT